MACNDSFRRAIQRAFDEVMNAAGFAPPVPVQEWYWFGVEYMRRRVSVSVVCNVEFGWTVEVNLCRPSPCEGDHGRGVEMPWEHVYGASTVQPLEVICERHAVQGAKGKAVSLQDDVALTAHLSGLAAGLRAVMPEIATIDDAPGRGRHIAGMCRGDTHVAYCISASDEPSFYVLLDLDRQERVREQRFVKLDELRAKWDNVERGELRLETVAEASRRWAVSLRN